MSRDYDTSHSDAQIEKWHQQAEDKATEAKIAEQRGDNRRAAALRREARQLVFKAARLRGQRD